MEEAKKNNNGWGGRREGGGRKPTSPSGAKVSICCRVNPETKRIVDCFTEGGRMTLAELIDRSVTLYAKYSGLIK